MLNNLRVRISPQLAPEDKLDRSLLNSPTRKGNAPTFKSDGTSVEIYHDEQVMDGRYQEMHWFEQRGKENFKKIIQTLDRRNPKSIEFVKIKEEESIGKYSMISSLEKQDTLMQHNTHE